MFTTKPLAKAGFSTMKLHEQALLFLRKAAEDEAIIDEVLTSERVSDTTSVSIFRRPPKGS